MLFNKPNDDEYYNIFTSKRIKEEGYDNGIYFIIEKVRCRTDRENFNAKKTLEDGISNVRFSRIFSDAKPEPDHTRAGTKRHEDSIEHLYRRYRKSARPKFLSGRERRSTEKKGGETALPIIVIQNVRREIY